MQTPTEVVTIARYGAVGVLNTAVTAAAFFLLRKAGVQVDLSNFLAYALGVANSFVWNKLWTFRSRHGHWTREGSLFLLGAAVCWALQWALFRGLMLIVAETWAYLLAMCAYPALNYLFNRFITFRRA